jgi:rsbT co-antagonist protein RsbR
VKPERLPAILKKYEAEVLTEWMSEQLKTIRKDLIRESELKEQSAQMLRLLNEALARGAGTDIHAPEWAAVKALLAQLSRARGLQGFTPTETATFVFSLKQALFAQLNKELLSQPEVYAKETWVTSVLLDALGLYTTEVHQKAREEVISRQQEDLLELSTPVVELYKGILALPLIGTLDSNRTQTVMESLLQRIVETGSEVAIIDITGVPTVDTLTAQHLLKTVTATRLMGADCIISGVRPQIAQTIVHLGVNLGDVTTKASLAAAFTTALQRSGLTVARAAKPSARG